jgi:hypothetical protein
VAIFRNTGTQLDRSASVVTKAKAYWQAVGLRLIP